MYINRLVEKLRHQRAVTIEKYIVEEVPRKDPKNPKRKPKKKQKLVEPIEALKVPNSREAIEAPPDVPVVVAFEDFDEVKNTLREIAERTACRDLDRLCIELTNMVKEPAYKNVYTFQVSDTKYANTIIDHLSRLAKDYAVIYQNAIALIYSLHMSVLRGDDRDDIVINFDSRDVYITALQIVTHRALLSGKTGDQTPGHFITDCFNNNKLVIPVGGRQKAIESLNELFPDMVHLARIGQ